MSVIREVPFEKPAGHAELAEGLTNLAKRAGDGEFVTGFFVMFRADGTFMSEQRGASINILETVGILETLKSELISQSNPWPVPPEEIA